MENTTTDVKCSKCEWTGTDDDLINVICRGEPIKACPACRTDEYLQDVNDSVDPISPHICILKIDESEYWQKNIVALAGGKIFGVYLYDANRHVRCCEMTPSYELHPLESQPLTYTEDEDQRDQLWEYIARGDANCFGIEYMHVRTVDGFPEIKSDSTPDGKHGRFTLSHLEGEEWGKTSEEAVEEALEWVRCNSV